jgi:dTDP-glucose 4,6-dehydratase
VVGTFRLLEASAVYFHTLPSSDQATFRFLHVSTDEVFGTLNTDAAAFTEDSPYRPNSPYAASKASSDHLARAWHETYGLPVILTNCSNNYGPWQFPEKLIPLTIMKAVLGEKLPVYGRGENVRDWLHVEDHAHALALIVKRGRPGARYNIGGRSERRNIDVVQAIARLLDERLPHSPLRPHGQLIAFVEDRPGHDFRYAIDAAKLESDLGWSPAHTFESGLAETVDWYLRNEAWWQSLRRTRYAGERLGSLPKAG